MPRFLLCCFVVAVEDGTSYVIDIAHQCVLPPDPARELKVLISNLLELLTEKGVSGQGRDNALTLLIKMVPRKSPKDPNNSLTLWVIDQGK